MKTKKYDLYYRGTISEKLRARVNNLPAPNPKNTMHIARDIPLTDQEVVMLKLAFNPRELGIERTIRHKPIDWKI